MKKIHVMLIALLGFMSSNTAMAIDLQNGPNAISFLTCTQLANDIDVILSNNVVGSLDCTTDTTIIGVSVCHTTGLTTERSFSTAADYDSTNDTYSCTAGTLNSTTNKCEGTTSGSAFPTATTAAGTVASQYPATDCSAGNAATVATAAVTAAQ